MLSTLHALKLSCYDKEFVLRLDAFDVDVGAVLLEEHAWILHHMENASRKSSAAEVIYAVVKREYLAIVWAIQKFQTYFFGPKFTLQTDHHRLSYVEVVKLANHRLMHWSLTLKLYTFQIQVIHVYKNTGANFLSFHYFNINSEACNWSIIFGDRL